METKLDGIRRPAGVTENRGENPEDNDPGSTHAHAYAKPAESGEPREDHEKINHKDNWPLVTHLDLKMALAAR